MAGESLPVRPGQLVGARYRVDRVLGESAMAVVVAARDTELDEPVAVKILLSQRVANSEARARFGREARAAVKIKGENVARVLDVGALPDGTPYMVMEYLEGESLASLLQRRGPVPPAAAIVYAIEVSRALREAHALGILHRSLEPANLFVTTRRGRPPILKVLNFGISRVETGGSPRYMAPEQLKGAPSVESRSDIWSLGVILYELVSGQVPFTGASTPDVIAKVLNDTPHLRAAPKELEPVIRRCLSKSPAGRFANVAELVEALEALEGLPMVDNVRSSMHAPDTIPEEVVAEVGDDEAELVDEEEEEDEGEVVDERELLFSAPPPATAHPKPPAPPPAKPQPKVTEAKAAATARGRHGLLIAVAVTVALASFAATRLRRAPVAKTPDGPPPQSVTVPPAPLATAAETVTTAPEPPPTEPPLPPPKAATAPAPPPARPIVRAEAPAAATITKPEDDATVALEAAMRHHGSLRQACWETSEKTTQVVSVSAQVDPAGAVSSASARSADAQLAECVAAQVRSWTFPPSSATRSLQIPIRFRK